MESEENSKRVRFFRGSSCGDSQSLVGACLATAATGDRIFATGSDTVSRCVLRSCASFCLISGHAIMVWKGPRSPKHIVIINFLWSYLSPLSLLLGREPCGNRILRSCLQSQKCPSTLKNFMTSSGCSMEGALQRRKRYQPYWGSTILKRLWGRNVLCFPEFGDLQPYETCKFRIKTPLIVHLKVPLDVPVQAPLQVPPLAASQCALKTASSYSPPTPKQSSLTSLSGTP